MLTTDLLPEMHPPGSRTSLSLCCLQCPFQKSSDTPETLGKDEKVWDVILLTAEYVQKLCVNLKQLCNAKGFKQ